jgi:hypothetical protein
MRYILNESEMRTTVMFNNLLTPALSQHDEPILSFNGKPELGVRLEDNIREDLWI